MVTLVGPNDEFLKRLEDALDADILVRGNEIHRAGHPADLADAGDILSEMITIIRTGQGLSADDVDRVVVAEDLELGVLLRRVLPRLRDAAVVPEDGAVL